MILLLLLQILAISEDQVYKTVGFYVVYTPLRFGCPVTQGCAIDTGEDHDVQARRAALLAYAYQQSFQTGRAWWNYPNAKGERYVFLSLSIRCEEPKTKRLIYEVKREYETPLDVPLRDVRLEDCHGSPVYLIQWEKR